jgi:AbrB family looped-hinge helix DNA binding protein
MLAKVTYKGQLTIPKEIREQVGLKDGDYVDIEIVGNKLLLNPKLLIDKDQAWFWTREWQEKEKEVDQDIKAGRVHSFESTDEAIRWLKEKG